MSATRDFVDTNVTITSGGSDSPAISINRLTPIWIDTPSDLVGDSLQFLANGKVIRGIYGQALTLTLGAAGSRHTLLQDQLAFLLSMHDTFVIRVMTGSSPAVQTGDKVLALRLGPTL